jgi:hypothetical protein
MNRHEPLAKVARDELSDEAKPFSAPDELRPDAYPPPSKKLFVESRDGLEDGDQVVLSPPATLRDGSKVKLAATPEKLEAEK